MQENIRPLFDTAAPRNTRLFKRRLDARYKQERFILNGHGHTGSMRNAKPIYCTHSRPLQQATVCGVTAQHHHSNRQHCAGSRKRRAAAVMAMRNQAVVYELGLAASAFSALPKTAVVVCTHSARDRNNIASSPGLFTTASGWRKKARATTMTAIASFAQKLAVGQFIELVPFRALLDHDRRGRHWIAGQQRHHIVEAVARGFEWMPRLLTPPASPACAACGVEIIPPGNPRP
jgi:hypothetical protein